jgi:Outer membrane efflux protein
VAWYCFCTLIGFWGVILLLIIRFSRKHLKYNRVRRLLFLPTLLLTCSIWAQKNAPLVGQQPYDNRSPYQLPLQFQNGSDTLRPRTFEDYLTFLAWNYSYEIEGASHDVAMKEQEIRLAKNDWKRNIASAGLNMNDVALPYFMVNTLGIETLFGRKIDLTRVPNVATFPVWNVGTTVNFGDLVLRKNKVNAAAERKKISQAEMNFKKQKLRGEVIKRYHELVSTYEILKVRLQALDAAENIKIQISNLFSLNKSNLEDYNQANKNYFDALESKIRAESDIKIKKAGLEELIGYRWEQVEPLRANYEKK